MEFESKVSMNTGRIILLHKTFVGHGNIEVVSFFVAQEMISIIQMDNSIFDVFFSF